MKKFELKKEIWMWIIMVLPMIYLLWVWPTLPEIVPTHFGMDGKPNDWSSKTTLVYLIAGLSLGIYLLFLVIPVIDPKDKLKAMGNKYFMLRFILTLFMSVLCIVIIRSAITANIGDGSVMFIVIGALFIFLGNYMQTVKPNYFIGIRTPWTLENETVWNKTHQLGGKLYFIGGILMVLLAFMLKEWIEQASVGIIVVASVIPVLYSYILFRKLKNGAGNHT